MKKYIISLLIIFYAFPTNGNSQLDKNITTKALKVGNQLWMAENLDVAFFRNGNTIKQAKSMKEWLDADDNKTPAWCYPGFNNSNSQFGKLYNVFAVNDIRGLAPKGWAIPSDYDWDLLVDYVGDEITGGKQLQSLPIALNGAATNFMGSFFNKRPGSMNLDGFWGLGESNSWWSMSTVNERNWVRYINKEGPIARRLSSTWGQGMAIRCIKSESSVAAAPKEYVENYDDNYNSIYNHWKSNLVK